MSHPLMLPRLGETMEQGRVVAWIKQPGESFVRGETIVEIETDKTVVELPALADGVLRRIFADVGTDIDVGSPLGEYDAIGEEGSAAGDSAEDNSDEQQPATEADREDVASLAPAQPISDTSERSNVSRVSASFASTPLSGASTFPLRATPAARHLARQHAISLAQARGTGRRQRIERCDIEALLSSDACARSTSPTPAVSAPIRYCALPAGRMAFREWTPTETERRSDTQAVPLVLLHGFAGDGAVWSTLAAQLQREGYHIFAPDLPCHGATAFDGESIDVLVQAVLDFLDRQGLTNIALAGHSLGGAVACKVARQQANRIKRLTLIAPAGLGVEIDGEFIDGMASVRHGGGLLHLLQRTALTPPLLSNAQLDQMAAAIHERGALRTLAPALISGSYQQVSISEELATMEMPTRVIWGLEDQIIPWQQAARAGERVAVHFIPRAGHMPHWDQPRTVAALMSA